MFRLKSTIQNQEIQEAKQKIAAGLANVRDTVTLAHKFVGVLGSCGIENVDAYLTGFKELYGTHSFYQGVKNSILHEVESIGLNPYLVQEYL